MNFQQLRIIRETVRRKFNLTDVANALYTDLVVPIRQGTAWGPAAAGLIVVGLGVPLYFLFKRRG